MLRHYGLSNSSAIQGSNSLNQGSGRTNGWLPTGGFVTLKHKRLFVRKLMRVSSLHSADVGIRPNIIVMEAVASS